MFDFGVPHGNADLCRRRRGYRMCRMGGGYGRFIELWHNPHMETAYGHMSRIASAIGQHVHQGQVIGYVGMTR